MDLKSTRAAFAGLLLILGLVWTGRGLVAGPDVSPGAPEGDAARLHAPVGEFVRRALARGELPLWNPHALLGQPVFAEGHTRLFYPPSWPLLALAPGRALWCDLLLHLVLLGLAVAHLARTTGLGRTGAVVAGVAALAGPAVAVALERGDVPALVTLVWLVLSVSLAARVVAGDRGQVPLLAAALGLACHAGDFRALAVLLACGLPAAVVLALRRRLGPGLPPLAVAVVVGLGLGAVQLLPHADLARRAARPRSAASPAAPGSAVRALLALPAPPPARPVGCDPGPARAPGFGFALVIAAVTGLLLVPDRRSLLVAAAAALCIASASGLEPPLPGSLSRALAWIRPGPGVPWPDTFVLLWALVLQALLAGRAVDALGGYAPVPRSTLGRTAAFLLALAALLAWLAHGTARPAAAAGGLAPLIGALGRDAALAAILGATVLLRVRGPLPPPLALVPVGLVLLELAAFVRAPLPSARPVPLPAGAAAYLAGRPAATRIDVPQPWPPMAATALGLDGVRGFSHLPLARSRALLQASQGRAAASADDAELSIVRHDGLARVLCVARSITPGGGLPPPGLEHRNSPDSCRFLEAGAPLSRAWIVHRVRQARNDAAALTAMGLPGFDPALEVLVSSRSDAATVLRETRTVTATPSGRTSAEGVRSVRRACGSIEIEATLSTPGIVVVSEAHDPGWTAAAVGGTGAGSPGPVVRVAVGLLGIVLGPGTHRVLFTYRPRGFGHAAAVTLLSLAALAVLWFRLRRRDPAASGAVAQDHHPGGK